jgi:hypothetical protein
MARYLTILQTRPLRGISLGRGRMRRGMGDALTLESATERRRNLFWFNTLTFERLKTEEEEKKTLIWFHFQYT